MLPEATSEAPTAQVQEPVADATEASEAQAPAAQEQTPSAQPAPAAAPEPDIDALLDHPRVKERLEKERARLQSIKDREVHQARMQAQQQAQEQLRLMQEQQRASQMDDEEYGRWRREQEAEQAKLAAYFAQQQQQFEQARQQWNLRVYNAGLALIKDEKARAAMAERAAEFPDEGAFLEACAEAQRDADVTREGEKKARAAREAALKDAAAKQAEQAIPDLGSGLPIDIGKKYPNTSHGRAQMLADGWQEEIARKKGG